MSDSAALGGVGVELQTHRSIEQIGEQAWSRLCSPETPPFLSYPWLSALERSGCVAPERGWLPMHLSFQRGDTLVAAAPCYVKGNSEGEFVFDHSWAHYAYETLGVDYYPKLIVAVPFTPATGPRLLTAPGVDEDELLLCAAAGIEGVVKRLGLSGAHVLFPPQAQAEVLAARGGEHRYGVQFHWHNRGYSHFDEFLSCFSAKRRAQIRRERRALAVQSTVVEVRTGSEVTPEVVDTVFSCYRDTVSKFAWGRQYLNRAFFEEICSTMKSAVHVVLARDAGSGRPIACAFNLLGARALYGRYWGALEQRPFLHFNLCYYSGVKEAISRGLELFEPGAGGEHKLVRGFEPSLTHSVHFLQHRPLADAVGEFLARERSAVAAELECFRRQPPLKPKS